MEKEHSKRSKYLYKQNGVVGLLHFMKTKLNLTKKRVAGETVLDRAGDADLSFNIPLGKDPKECLTYKELTDLNLHDNHTTYKMAQYP